MININRNVGALARAGFAAELLKTGRKQAEVQAFTHHIHTQTYTNTHTPLYFLLTITIPANPLSLT